MDYKDFEKLKERFSRANTDEKVSLYVNTPGLTKDQYRELLEMYPKKTGICWIRRCGKRYSVVKASFHSRL